MNGNSARPAQERAKAELEDIRLDHVAGIHAEKEEDPDRQDDDLLCSLVERTGTVIFC